MIVTPIKTKKVVKGDQIYKILLSSLPKLHEKDIVVITSKIISICENRIVKDDFITREELMKKEADYYLPGNLIKHNVSVTIKANILVASAGIDKSNGNGYLILWPKDPRETANNIWRYLRKRYSLKHLGVIITDSHTTPLRRGVSGIGIAWCGFSPLRNYIGTKDIFGKIMQVSKANIVDSLAASAVVAMGEGSEQTPLAVIQDVPNIEFKVSVSTKLEYDEITINMEDDIYAALFTSVPWEKGEYNSK